MLGQFGRDLLGVAAEQGEHAGLDGCGGLGHGQAALADEGEGVVGAQHPGAGGGGDLADAVAGDGADQPAGGVLVREQRAGGHQAGGDQQRLRDGGVLDLLGVRLGTRAHKVEPGDLGPTAEAVGDAVELQPGAEETGGLGTLSRGDDYEHGSTLSRQAPGGG